MAESGEQRSPTAFRRVAAVAVSGVVGAVAVVLAVRGFGLGRAPTPGGSGLGNGLLGLAGVAYLVVAVLAFRRMLRRRRAVIDVATVPALIWWLLLVGGVVATSGGGPSPGSLLAGFLMVAVGVAVLAGIRAIARGA